MTMTDKFRKMDRGLLELLTGILLFGAACQLAALFLPVDAAQHAAGLWTGILLAMLFAVHMLYSLNKAFTRDEKSAARLIAGGYIARYLLTFIILALLYYTGIGYLLSGFLGVMGLKTGAYLQPFIHKFYNWIFHETDPVAQPLCEDAGEASEDMEK